MAPSKIEHGHGRVVLHNHGSANVFSELVATYPLKLLAPRLPSQNVSIVYMLTYGGGLVGGDRIHLHVDVHDAATLVILSQVSPLSLSSPLSDSYTTRGLPRSSKPVRGTDSRPTTTFTLLRHSPLTSALHRLPPYSSYLTLSLASETPSTTKSKHFISPRTPPPSCSIGSPQGASPLGNSGSSPRTIA